MADGHGTSLGFVLRGNESARLYWREMLVCGRLATKVYAHGNKHKLLLYYFIARIRGLALPAGHHGSSLGAAIGRLYFGFPITINCAGNIRRSMVGFVLGFSIHKTHSP